MKNEITQQNIPSRWEALTFKDLGISVIDGDRGVNYPKQDDFSSQGYCLFLNAGNVTCNGFKFSEVSFITEHKDKKMSKGKLSRDDLVITTRGTIGNIAHYSEQIPYENMRINSGMAIMRNHKEKSKINTNFLLHYFNSSLFSKELKRVAFGSAQPQLTIQIINKFAIKIPKDKSEQNRIVSILEVWNQAIEKLKRKIETKKEIKKGLMQELLTGKKRFSGFRDKWKQIEIGNFCEIKRGGSPRPIQDYMTEDEYGLNWLKIGDVQRGSRYIFRTTGKIRKEGLNKTTVVNEGDFILSNSMSFGRPYIMKLSACIHDGWLALKNISSEVNKDFLYYLLSSELIQAKFRSISAGSGVLNLKKESVAEVVVQIPSLQEQNQIANLLTASDDEIDGLEQKLSIFVAQKKYLLNNLVTGTIRTPESLSIPK